MTEQHSPQPDNRVHEFHTPFDAHTSRQGDVEFARERELLNEVQTRHQALLTFEIDGSHPSLASRAMEAVQRHTHNLDQVTALWAAGRLLRTVVYADIEPIPTYVTHKLQGSSQLGVAFLLPDRDAVPIRVPVATSYDGMISPVEHSDFTMEDAALVHRLASELVELKTSGRLPYLQYDLTAIMDMSESAWPPKPVS